MFVRKANSDEHTISRWALLFKASPLTAVSSEKVARRRRSFSLFVSASLITTKGEEEQGKNHKTVSTLSLFLLNCENMETVGEATRNNNVYETAFPALVTLDELPFGSANSARHSNAAQTAQPRHTANPFPPSAS